MRSGIGRLMGGLVLLGSLVASVPAEARELYWRELAVEARLGADGALQVVERHTMVFTGDWNGGERAFLLYAGQDLELESVTRFDPTTGERRQLERGDLGRVDHYDWYEGDRLRWRSRRPSDPPFDDTAIGYEIVYRLTGILLPLGAETSTYRLDHDFAFADRVGDIERFRLDLELDPIWRPVYGFERSFELFDMPPGRGVPVTADLVYSGDGRPAAALPGGTPLPLRLAFLAAALLAAGSLALRFFTHEHRLGRSAGRVPVPPEAGRAWIRETLLEHRAEVVGAAWDQQVGPPEVAALIARWVAEGKVESTVPPADSRWWRRRRELGLRLLADRDTFHGYERRLIDKLFFGRRDEVTTADLRERYKSTGFSPASTVRSGIERRRKRLVGRGSTPPPSRRPALVLLGLVVVLLAAEALTRPAAAQWAAGFLGFVGLPLYVIGLGGAFAARKRVERLAVGSLSFLVPAALVLAAAGLYLLGAHRLIGVAIAPGIAGGLATATAPVLVLLSLFHNARSRESAEQIARRRELVAARRWLAQQLERPEPELDDGWYPYLLAFGLSSAVDRWSESFGGTSGAATGTLGGLAGTSSSGSSSGGGFTGGGGWTGGGQVFGGAGASASWAAAATGLAAGVSAPSSSSSGGGGGGGGSSSGGGGGGGW